MHNFSTSLNLFRPRGDGGPLASHAYKPCSKGGGGGFEVSLIAGVKSAKTATAVSSRAAGMEATWQRLTQQPSAPLDEAIQVLQRSHLNDSALSRHERCRELTPSSRTLRNAGRSLYSLGSRGHTFGVIISMSRQWLVRNITNSAENVPIGRASKESD